MILTLPLPRNLPNWRTHWANKHREQKAYARKCDYLVVTGDVPRAPRQPFRRVRLAYTLHLCGKPMDLDNATGRCKWIGDWLVRAGYLEDDNPDVVTEIVTRQVRVPHRHDARVVVEITPLSEEEAA